MIVSLAIYCVSMFFGTMLIGWKLKGPWKLLLSWLVGAAVMVVMDRSGWYQITAETAAWPVVLTWAVNIGYAQRKKLADAVMYVVNIIKS